MMKSEMQGYLDFREQIDKLNEASLQTFYTLLLNKTIYVVRQIGKELQQANTSSFIKTNEKIADSTHALSEIFSHIPKRWKANQVLLNNFTKLELELFTFITHAKDTLHKLHSELDKKIERQYLEALKNISAASHHSTQILYDTMEDVLQNLDADSFDESWEKLLSSAMSELKFYLDNVENKISLLDRAVFDDFKDAQFADQKAVNLRARKLVEYVLKTEFIQPVEETVNETMQWMSDEINDTMQIIEKGTITLKVLRNDKSKAADLPQLSPMIESLNTQLLEAEKNKLRMLNQVRERTNALADKFSLSAVTRRGTVYKKFIR
jgi:hypothetical protein